MFRSVEIPCLICPTRSHFIQNKLEISVNFTSPGTCLFDLILNVPVNNFSFMLGLVSLGLTSSKKGLLVIEQLIFKFTILYFIFGKYYELLTCCVRNSVDPDQLASSEAS